MHQPLHPAVSPELLQKAKSGLHLHDHRCPGRPVAVKGVRVFRRAAWMSYQIHTQDSQSTFRWGILHYDTYMPGHPAFRHWTASHD